MKYLILNPEYALKPDLNRALILTKDALRAIDPYVESVIHPVHARLLSFFSGALPKNIAITQAAIFLNVEETFVSKFIDELTDNPKPVMVKYTEDEWIIFPKKTLISSNKAIQRTIYNPEIFTYEYFNHKVDRHLLPRSITFMATTKCYTNCVYCYANLRKKYDPISIDRMKQIILEARRLNVISFDVIGGEFFLYEHWKEVLLLLHENGYNPYISTKVPISEDDVVYLKSIGVKDVQVSLDTLIPEHIPDILRVKKEYVEQIKRTLSLLNKYGIEIQIHTILTNINGSIDDMISIRGFIENLSSLVTWKIDYASSTIYKSNKEYTSIKISRDNLQEIYLFFEAYKLENPPFRIVSGDLNVEDDNENNDKDLFYTNQRPVFCAGNYSSIFILPDGKVTICEELYWNPRFIIGDCKENTLEEIWNSQAATSLYYLSRHSVSPNSPCSKCDIFEECHQELGSVCWREIIKAYGDEKWDYPDPECPKAIKVESDIYI